MARRRRRVTALTWGALACGAVALMSGRVEAAPLKIAAELSTTGSGALYSKAVFDGVRLALDESNADTSQPAIEIETQNDNSDPSKAVQIAEAIGRGDALAVVGPILTVVAVKTGPVYAEAGLASIAGTAHGDVVPAAATTFQTIFNSGQMGAGLAQYLSSGLHGKRSPTGCTRLRPSC